MLTNEVKYMIRDRHYYLGYYRHGVLHRVNGPALLTRSGNTLWVLYGNMDPSYGILLC